MDGSFVYKGGYISKVPATDFEALKSDLMGFLEKRRAQKFFAFCQNYDEKNPATQEDIKDLSKVTMKVRQEIQANFLLFWSQMLYLRFSTTSSVLAETPPTLLDTPSPCIKTTTTSTSLRSRLLIACLCKDKMFSCHSKTEYFFVKVRRVLVQVPKVALHLPDVRIGRASSRICPSVCHLRWNVRLQNLFVCFFLFCSKFLQATC